MRISDWSSDVCSSDLDGGNCGIRLNLFDVVNLDGSEMLNELGDVALLCERPLFGLEVAQRRALKAYRGFLAVDRLPVEFGLALRAVFLREGFFSCACSLVATDASDSPAAPVCLARSPR